MFPPGEWPQAVNAYTMSGLTAEYPDRPRRHRRRYGPPRTGRRGGDDKMKHLIEPKSVTLSWCPVNCPEYGPAPLYGIPACFDYCPIFS